MNKAPPIALLLLLASAAPPRGARAGELSLPGEGRSVSASVTQTLDTYYHTDTDVLSGNTNDAYAAINNRTDLVLLHGSTSFNLRLDGTGFVGTDEGSPHTGHFGLEKISLTTNQRAFDVTLGDLYLRVGKGLTLDLTRVTALYRDTSLRGAQARVRTRYVDGEIFGGWVNPLAMDHFMELPRDIPSDMIGGARVEARPNREVIIGAHYVGGGCSLPRACRATPPTPWAPASSYPIWRIASRSTPSLTTSPGPRSWRSSTATAPTSAAAATSAP